MIILIAISPFVRNQKAATKAYVLGSTGGILMLSIVIVIALLVFGVLLPFLVGGFIILKKQLHKQ
ncbi:hypothetical protein [Priestia flexa]|uniref:hypothetical protein n=1 Tax=Priestia flexa TaxID=86664 RepID=UPI000970ADB6|nr:hypothetical protein [Priestia flexa]MBY6085618.1 hypothetical protein [Priestia flexa]WEZ06774.1 hypothetical protein P5663_11725 [Priestia flexa]